MIIGIDPGQTGAIAFLGPTGQIEGIVDMPVDVGVSPAGVADALNGFTRQSRVIIEQVASMPGQGVASTFKFGVGYGILQGVVASIGYEMHLVRPAVWKKAMGVSAEKGTSRRKAMQLWPDKADLFARVKDDGRAEAALIARYYYDKERKGG